jgi:trehalose 6-phosphate synthase
MAIETKVRSFPISVNGHADWGAAQGDTLQATEKLRQEFNLQGMIVGVGVDRIDYTKGIAERMLAIGRFLEKYPQYRRKFVFVQLAAPSRTHIKRYHDLISEIDELVEKINWKYMEGTWKPILYLKRYFSADEIEPFYHLADVCIVSSLHDGMNLVAKEYVATKRDTQGVLLLSQFTGAARELVDAVPINPYSIEEFADSIRFAIEMPPDEKQKRMQTMREIVRENNVYRWAASIITDLVALKKP